MKNEIKILFTGDFYGGNKVEKFISEKAYDKIFGDFTPYITESQIAVTNLESALTESESAILKTGPAIKSRPDTIHALKFAGFNLLTLANNHIMDFGEVGLNKTLQICNSNDIDIVGAGENLEAASKVFYQNIGGKTIAFLNFAENEWSTTQGSEAGANPINPVSNYYSITEARKKADLLLVVVHGGHENIDLPSPRMKQTYRFFIDAGADAVIGHHTHCYSGYETYNGKPIFYSLGNFIFDSISKRNESWYKGFAVQFIVTDNLVDFKVIPYFQNYDGIGLKLFNDDENRQFEKHIEALNQIIQDDKRLLIEFKKRIKKVERGYSAYIEPHSNRIIAALQNRNVLPSFLTKRKRRLLLNLIRCEAHRDILLEILK